MTRIDFHTGVADQIGYACRLVRKAYGAGQQTVVVGEPSMLATLDAALWTFSSLDFIPHCGVDSPLAAQTPVVLSTSPGRAPHHAVLINLGGVVPEDFARFERLLEIVGATPDAVTAGRDRYRFYRDRGYQLTNHVAA
jgi:DNA polymerase III subunit chi